jgi:hypothetical protein
MKTLPRLSAFAVLLALSVPVSILAAPAQDVPAAGEKPSPSPSPSPSPTAEGRDDLEPNRMEPDFTLINLPTTARLPRHKSAFRVTHRFARPLGEGDFGDLAADAFAFDGGAQIGLEYRFAVASGTQLGFYRTSDRTTEFFAQQDLWQPDAHPVGAALVASVEGLDNFHEERQPRISLVLSRPLAERATLYAVPTFVGNSNIGIGGGASESKDNTLMVGLGLRLRLGAGASILAEYTPRVSGFKGGDNADDHVTFALEKRVGGHAFQINVSNDLGTTPGQIARGTQGADGWFIGFNISRKFY